MSEISLNYENVLELNTTPTQSLPTWSRLCKGFANLSEGLNEVLYQASYLCDQGWGSTEVTGGQYIVTLTGVRYFGDAVQDWLFSDAVMYKWGAARKTQLRVRRQDKTILEWDVTLANITNSGGDANQPGAISVTIHGNGAPYAPDIDPGEMLAPLTVVSVAGTSQGDTMIYVNPVLSGGNSYVYMSAADVMLPALDAVLTAGWTAWNGTSDIAGLVGGNMIALVEIDSANKAKKGGIAIVTVAA